MFIQQLEKDPIYAEKVLKMCGIDTVCMEGLDIRVNVLIRDHKPINITYAKHYDTLMDKDIGPIVSMGSVIWGGSIHDKILSTSLANLGKVFDKIQDNTFLSFNVSISKDKVNIRNFQPHVSPGFMVLYKGTLDTLNLDKDINLRDGYVVTITLAALPFPLQLTYPNIEVYGINSYNIKHIIMHGLRLMDKRYVGNGLLCTITAHGSTVREARRRAYRTVGNIKADGIMYRSDIGMDVIRIQNQLQTWGWIN